ncbi:elicitin-like protein [Phytophthora cinnamomi]|uniref:elicitin-like protein n=1 Tax=Phytophthora cinnamomi TaxID=4785 RepID=UPI00355A847D|nr:elicitin-like protein [Phytophthora cinnamomi]
MKVFASALIAATMTASVAHAATCDTASVTALLTSDEVTSCASDSGYSPSSLKTPTKAEMDIMCSDTACQTVLSDLTTMFPEECTVGTFALYADLITPVTSHCGSSTSSSSTAASASTSASSTAASASVATSTSSASLGSAAEVTAAPANTTSSASSNNDVTVGDSASGSYSIETQTPATEAPSSSTTADSAASSSSAADNTSSSTSTGMAVNPSTALLGSALVVTAALLL